MINNFESDKAKHECMKLTHLCPSSLQFNTTLSSRDTICDVTPVGAII